MLTFSLPVQCLCLLLLHLCCCLEAELVLMCFMSACLSACLNTPAQTVNGIDTLLLPSCSPSAFLSGASAFCFFTWAAAE